jgi:hypothetical protein
MGSKVFGTGVTNWCVRDKNEVFHVLWIEVILTAVIETR